MPITPPWLFIKVLAMAPPIIILSTTFINFSITPILSETFAPPKIAVNGALFLYNNLLIFFNSFSINRPIHEVLISFTIALVEACNL